MEYRHFDDDDGPSRRLPSDDPLAGDGDDDPGGVAASSTGARAVTRARIWLRDAVSYPCCWRHTCSRVNGIIIGYPSNPTSTSPALYLPGLPPPPGRRRPAAPHASPPPSSSPPPGPPSASPHS
eukprot:3324714-Rhodomonas_salina.1